MKRLVRYKLNFASRWLTLSGVMMGVAFFAQALDYFALRQLQNVDMLSLLLYLILPMLLEAAWCVPLRSECTARAEVHGVLSALICLLLLAQAVVAGGVFTIVMAAVFFLLSAAAAVLITWGFIPHRALGLLVFAAAAAVRVLVFALPRYVAAPGYMTLVQELPAVCLILAMLLLYGGITLRDEE